MVAYNLSAENSYYSYKNAIVAEYKNGYGALSLLVLGDNTDAQRLYKRCGFEVRETVDLKSHELISHEGGSLLMKCEVDP